MRTVRYVSGANLSDSVGVFASVSDCRRKIHTNQYGGSVPGAGMRIWSKIRIQKARYSITSLAAAYRAAETIIPSAFAVFKLMTRSNLVGCTTGRSPGFVPLRMRPA